MRLPRTASATLWLALAQVSPVAVNILLTPFVITTLGETQFGLWLVTSAVAMLLGQLDGGVYRTSLRDFATRRAMGKVSLRSVVVFEAIVALIACFTLFPIILFPEPVVQFFLAPRALEQDLEILLRVIAIVVLVSLLRQVLVALLHSRGYFRWTALATMAGYLSYASTMFIALSQGYGLRGVAAAYVAQSVVATVLIGCKAMRLVSRTADDRSLRNFVGATLRMASRVQVAALLTALPQQGTMLVVGRLRPEQTAGFGPGATFAQNLRLVSTNALPPLQAALSNALDEGARESAVQRARRAHGVWVTALMAMYTAAVPAAYFGVNAWLPIEGVMPGLVAALLLFGHFFALLPQALLQWWISLGEPSWEVRASGVAVVIAIVAVLPLVLLLDAPGAAVAVVVGNISSLAYLHFAAARKAEPILPTARVPWWAGSLCGVVVLASQLLLHRHILPGTGLDSGAVALVLSALAAAPGLAAFACAAPISRTLLIDLMMSRRSGR